MGGFRFSVEKVFSIPGRGVVVSGKVEEGRITVGQEIGFLGANGAWTNATVIAIEVAHRLVEEAEAGQKASLLLEGVKKSQIVPGTIFLESSQTPAALEETQPGPSPEPPASAKPSLPSEGSAPTTLGQGRAIHPSSSVWRLGILLLIGLLIIFALFLFQGKWDPVKKLTSVQPSARSNSPSAMVDSLPAEIQQMARLKNA